MHIRSPRVNGFVFGGLVNIYGGGIACLLFSLFFLSTRLFNFLSCQVPRYHLPFEYAPWGNEEIGGKSFVSGFVVTTNKENVGIFFLCGLAPTSAFSVSFLFFSLILSDSLSHTFLSFTLFCFLSYTFCASFQDSGGIS